MANKRVRKNNKKLEHKVRRVSKYEKDMFSLGARAHDKLGNLVWKS
jgi:hypothetical protein